jgi:hypothetical protein
MKKKRCLFTNESWYPSYYNKNGSMYVEATIHKWDKGNWGVSIWGEDDMGMEKIHLSQTDAYNLFMSLKDFITRDELIGMGFEYA